MPALTDDVRIRAYQALEPPAKLIRDLPCGDTLSATVTAARRALRNIIHGHDDRLIVIIGPCSIHDPDSALDYAHRLHALRNKLGQELEIVMRVYFEKPRTTVGWKGLINDPHLDGSFRINDGLRLARRILHDIAALGLPAGCEFLDTISPQYFADLVSWGAIGARTSESQIHREMASGLSCPVGFKNGTNGNVGVAVDAVSAAAHSHHFLAVTKAGQAAIGETRGNPDCHVILRGGKKPNYDADSIDSAHHLLASAGIPTRLMVDASHANSAKRPENQPLVVESLARQIESGDHRIMGVMVESHLVGGRQDISPGRPLTYGQSITDACLDWETSVTVLERLAVAAAKRRLQRDAAVA